MAQVPKNQSGVPLKWKDHFPLGFITKPAGGAGQGYKSKRTLLYDRMGNLLGEFDSRVAAEAEAERYRKDPDLLATKGGKTK
jgi:hypothetical protein